MHAPALRGAKRPRLLQSAGQFRLRVRDEMAEWRLKMRALDEKMETGSQRHINATETRLRNAWDDTEVRLESADRKCP